jgi:hypothetical protein
MEENIYIPGVCNIGREEIKQRKIVGIIGLIATVVTLFLLIYFNASTGFKLFIFIPAVISSIGFLQARAHFCIYYGWVSLFNFDSLGKKNKVEKDEYKIADKKKSFRIVVYSLLIGLIIVIAAMII